MSATNPDNAALGGKDLGTHLFPGVEPIEGDAAEALFYHEAGLKATWALSRMSAGAMSFLFGAFLFTYFYLRSINAHGLWHPHGAVDPTEWAGTLAVVLIVVSAALQSFCLRRIKAGDKAVWMTGARVALACGVVAGGLYIYQLAAIPFPAGASGYDSVWTAFTPVYALIALATMVWLWILVVRASSIPAQYLTEQPPSYAETFTVQHFQARLSAFTLVWNYLAVVAVVFWFLFYIL